MSSEISSTAADTLASPRGWDMVPRMLALSHEVAAALTVEQLGLVIEKFAPEVLEYEQACFFHLDRKHGEFVACSLAVGQRDATRRPLESDYIAHVLHAAGPIFIADPTTDARWCDACDPRLESMPRSVLAVPLFSPLDQAPQGFLEFYNRRTEDFSAEEELLLATLVKYCEQALARVAAYPQRTQDFDPSLLVAREIQRRFMPSHMPQLPGYEAATWWLPTEAVGGDYCDVLTLSDNVLGLCVADVSGHGLGPSLLMASVRAALHALMLEHSSPQVLLEMVGRALAPDLHATGFITMVLAAIDLEAHTVRYSNAGHAPALHYSASTDKFQPLEATGVPLGVLEGPRYPLGPPLEMRVGDWLILCTDGIVEAMDHRGEQFGYERLHRIVQHAQFLTAAELVRQIGDEVSKYYEGEHPQDDLTILALKRCG